MLAFNRIEGLNPTVKSANRIFAVSREVTQNSDIIIFSSVRDSPPGASLYRAEILNMNIESSLF